MKSMTKISLLLVLGLTLHAVSCGIQLKNATPSTKSNQCTVDENCPGGQACEKELRVCIVPTTNALKLDLQLTPLDPSDFSREQLVGIDLSTKPALQIQLPKLIRISGVVRINGQPGGVRAKVLFAAPGQIGGTSFRYETSSTENGDGAFNYSLQVKPGLAYDIVVTRTGSELPTVRLQHTAGTSDERVDITLPSAAEHWTIAGKLFWSDGTPAEGVLLQAYEIDGKRTSTTSTSDGLGAFELVIPPGATRYALRASSGPDGSVVPTLDLIEIEASSDTTNASVIDFPTLPQSIATRITVVGTTSSGTGTPLANVSLVLTSQLLGGSVQQTALTDTSGTATLTLFAGSYQLTAIPPLESPFALKQQTLSLGADTGNQFEVALAPKLTVSGRLLLSNRTTAAKGATVIFTLTESVSSDLAVVQGRRVTLITNNDGKFEGELDPGFYNVFVTPTVTSGVPRKVFLSVAIDESGELPDLVLDPSAVFSGKVVDSVGNPVSGVTVEAFDGANPLPFALASGTTDVDGSFKLLVPFVEPLSR